jgi:hypothetical protein
VRGPIDEHRRDERCRHHGDERNRDDGQDIAHGERTTTPPRRAAAGTTRRPSRFKMARKYDRDNRRRFDRPIAATPHGLDRDQTPAARGALHFVKPATWTPDHLEKVAPLPS